MPDKTPATEPDNPTPEQPPKDLSPAEVAALTEAPSEMEDRGMGALEIFDKETKTAPDDLGDNGMSAVAPILSDETSKAEPPIPPYTSTTGAPLMSEDAFAPPGDFDTTPVPPPPDQPGLPPNPNVLNALVTPEDLKKLWARADALQKRVYEEINNANRARALLNQIQAARNYLMAGRDNYEEAERALNEVEYMVEFSQRVQKCSWAFKCKQGWGGKRLLFYELAWIALLAVAMFLVPVLIKKYAATLGYTQPNGLQSAQWLIDGFKSMFWGGLGGVTGALYALWRHIADKQDFDPQYTMWYITNPIMGIALGIFVYLVMQAGLVSMAGVEAQTTASAIPTFILAWMTGFQQNVAYSIVRRLLKVFEVADSSEAEAEPSPTTPQK